MQLLEIFEPYEMEMLICGRQAINLEDWKANTIFEGNRADQIYLQRFWSILEGFDQEMLENVLHFTTGSNAVPINGFKYLESNRGEIKKFTFRVINYNPKNEYPKAHTCFNRLEVPRYDDINKMDPFILFIGSCFIAEFGNE